MDWYTILKDFQTAIVGVVGFGGVILSLVGNAAAARRREKQDLSRRRLAVRGALLGELLSIDVQLKFNEDSLAKAGNDPEESAQIARLRHGTQTILSAEIGLLDELQIKSLMTIIEGIETVSETVELASRESVDSAKESSSARHFLVKSSEREFLLTMHRKCRSAIKIFLDAIAKDLT